MPPCHGYDLYIYANLCSLCIGHRTHEVYSIPMYTPLRQICHSLGTLWGHFGSKDGTTTYKTNPTYEIYVQTHHAPVLICTCGHVTSSCLLACSPMAVSKSSTRCRVAHTLPWTLSPSAAAPNRCGSTGNEDSLHTRPDPTPGLARARRCSQCLLWKTCWNPTETSSRPRCPRSPNSQTFPNFPCKKCLVLKSPNLHLGLAMPGLWGNYLKHSETTELRSAKFRWKILDRTPKPWRQNEANQHAKNMPRTSSSR